MLVRRQILGFLSMNVQTLLRCCNTSIVWQNQYVRDLIKFSLLLLLLLPCGVAYATINQCQSDTLSIYFRQGYAIWEPKYKENGENLLKFLEKIEQYRKDKQLSNISKIEIVAGCSPEGSWIHNQALSKKRAVTMRKVLGTYISLPDSVIVENASGINWEDLRKMVVADHDIPYKEEVLYHIDNSPEVVKNSVGKLVETRKLRLMYLKDGKPWRYMYEKFFPVLRSFNVVIVIQWDKLDITHEQKLSIPKVSHEYWRSLEYERIYELRYNKPQGKSPFYMALKTNLLYDVAVVPNLGAEFYLGSNWSVSANWMYAWWKNDTRHWYWRIYGGDLAIRKWFGKAAQQKPLTGHHAGVYGQMLTYDFEFGGRGYMGGVPGGTLWDRAHFAAGAEYGYALPIGKRLNLDFTIGMGYMGGEYREYIPVDNCYVWQVTKQRHWFGPTKAEISLVWLLGKGNVNKGKGGKR